MNISQKNYTITRVVSTLEAKLETFLEKEQVRFANCAQNPQIKDQFNISKNTVLNMILNKELLPKKSKENFDLKGLELWPISELFDMKPIKDLYNSACDIAYQDFLETKFYSRLHYVLGNKVYKSTSFYLCTKNGVKAVEKAQQLLNTATDNIMIGSEQSALDAIKAVDSLTF